MYKSYSTRNVHIICSLCVSRRMQMMPSPGLAPPPKPSLTTPGAGMSIVSETVSISTKYDRDMGASRLSEDSDSNSLPGGELPADSNLQGICTGLTVSCLCIELVAVAQFCFLKHFKKVQFPSFRDIGSLHWLEVIWKCGYRICLYISPRCPRPNAHRN
jgi:hypothetical protein